MGIGDAPLNNVLVTLYKDINFGGPRRNVVALVPDLSNDPRTTGFNDITSSVTIQLLGGQPTGLQSVSFYRDAQFGDPHVNPRLTMTLGAYPSLHVVSLPGSPSGTWGDSISSILFNPGFVPLGYTDFDTNQTVTLSPAAINPLQPWLLWVKCFKGDPVSPFGGDELDIFGDTPSLGTDYGPDWNDSVRGISTVLGTDYNNTAVVRLFPDDKFGGNPIDVPGNTSTELPNGFGLSSLQIVSKP